MKIKSAIISVSDKTNLIAFARGLSSLKIDIISTGGTAKLLENNGIKVKHVSDFTGFPEILDGRVKTLHPKVHGALLAIRENKSHMKQLEELEIEPIDLVVVNLYPFEKVSKSDADLNEVIENIDIGGVTLIRSAAKNYKNVAVVTDPRAYDNVLSELKNNNNTLSAETYAELSVDAFKYTSEYDAQIYNHLQKRLNVPISEFPDKLFLLYQKIQDLRYGENPHQRAAFYRNADSEKSCIVNARQLHGKELSYNNILDLNDAIEIVKTFERPTAVIIKHTNPCGCASSDSINEAYRLALETDSKSAFGSVVGLNEKVNIELAKTITSTFVEAIVAPDYDNEAIEILKQKKNLRVLQLKDFERNNGYKDMKQVVGGLLLQDRDLRELKKEELRVVSKKQPSEDEINSMLFAWKVCKYVKSNAIVLAKGEQTVGIGAGQMSRVDAVKIAIDKSNGRSKGSVLASDAFFPFRDGIDVAANGGIIAIIHPGGSIRDREVIDATNENNIAMVFTGIRCFKH